jgi:hypothetical protein
VEADEMTPNDLYSECAPVKQKRKASESMFFPLRPFKPDRFLAIPLEAQFRSGNSHMLSNARAKALLKRLGL